MKQLFLLMVVFTTSFSFAQQQQEASLKQVLLAQLKTTHNQKEWFVPVDVAVDGLTPEQAMWKDKNGNHSVAELVNHLVFWNAQQLAQFKNEKPEKFNGNNDETFSKLSTKDWKQLVKRLDDILTQIETLVKNANEAQLKKMANAVAHISTHNAYHIGEMVYVRKEQGSWDPAKGVK